MLCPEGVPVSDRPDRHVVMLVANDVVLDTRVKKEALALAQGGLRVTIIGIASERSPSSTLLGPVEIRRVEVRSTVRAPALERAANRCKEVSGRVQARERRLFGRPRTDAPGPGAGQDHRARDVARSLRRRAEYRLLRVGGSSLRVGEAALRRARRVVDHARERYQGNVSGSGGVRWRAIHPEVLDFEAAFAPLIDQLAPDVVHAHDMHVVGIAASACARARRQGRDIPWVYDAHEYVPGLSQYGGRTAQVIAGWADLEAEFIRDAARVVTVSPAIADALERHYGLRTHPAVVLNVPTTDPPGRATVTPLRAVCGLPADVPLITYSGGMTSARGVDTAVEAMTHLPGVHLALVCVPHNDTWYVRRLRQHVAEVGVGERVHFVNPVTPGQVVDFLRGVDAGLIPGLPFPSHEMSLPNKLFEYLHAGVPIVSSELESLGAFMREHGVGVTFEAGDPVALSVAVRSVLDDYDRYHAACEDADLLQEFSWSRQADELRCVYSELLGRPVAGPDSGETAGHEVVDLTEVPIGRTETPVSGASR